jgi:uracil-DNA glycosylase
MAVASEPYIFWRGENADQIISQIHIPPELGKLEPASPHLNGPSGRALDEYFLKPLGITRNQAWLCDLVPYSCQNPGQRRALEREYLSLARELNFPLPAVPRVPAKLTDEKRRDEILDEIEAANPKTIILLGDEPIRWFLSFFDSRWKKLSDFGEDESSYGQLHRIQIRNKSYDVVALVHPRQAARLGAHSPKWVRLHEAWMRKRW